MIEASPETSAVPAVRAFHQKSGLQFVALLCWAAAWMLAQSLLDAKGFNAQQQVTVFVLLATVVYGAGFIARREWFYQLLTSVQFAVSQMLLMALAVAVGMLIPQGEAPDFYASTYGPFLCKLISWSHSADLYHSLWFYALLSLLALSMAAVAWKRRPYPAHRVGFLLVHLSTSVIFLGALWGAYSSVHAYRELREGESTATFYKLENQRPGPERPYTLPDSRIQLNKATPQHPPKFKLYAFVKPDGKGGFEKDPKAYEVAEGMKAPLPHSKLHFSVERLLPNALDAGEFINNPTAPENPALRVILASARRSRSSAISSRISTMPRGATSPVDASRWCTRIAGPPVFWISCGPERQGVKRSRSPSGGKPPCWMPGSAPAGTSRPIP